MGLSPSSDQFAYSFQVILHSLGSQAFRFTFWLRGSLPSLEPLDPIEAGHEMGRAKRSADSSIGGPGTLPVGFMNACFCIRISYFEWYREAEVETFSWASILFICDEIKVPLAPGLQRNMSR